MKVRRNLKLASIGLFVAGAGGAIAIFLGSFGWLASGDDAEPLVAGSANPRDKTAFCIEVLDPRNPGAAALGLIAKSSIDAALDVVSGHRYWRASGLAANGEPIVDIGCPSPPLPSLGGVQWINGLPQGHAPGAVAELSYYQVFVFVIPLDEMDRMLGGTERRATTQEFTCSGDVCHGGTTGLYLTPGEVNAPSDFLVEKLQQALGLRES